MGEQSEQLKRRTRRFALDAIEVVRRIPRDEPGATLRRQLTKAATAVSANYRATCRARSRAEFVARMGVVSEEADESVHWLDLLIASNVLDDENVRSLHAEAVELAAIFSASYGTSRANL